MPCYPSHPPNPYRRDRPAEYILRARRPIPRGAPEGDGDPNNSSTSAESFLARIRRRRRAAVKGTIAGDELTRIDLDEIVELEISGVDEKNLTYLSFVGSNFGGGNAPRRPDRTLHPSVGVCEGGEHA